MRYVDHLSGYGYVRCMKTKHSTNTGKRVPTYEQLFDIIHHVHTAELGHPKDKRKNKATINENFYCVPIGAIELYLSLCPNCATGRKISRKAKRNPLKMILTNSVGYRCQVDLIDMTSQEDPVSGDKWIMRYVDHLSGYGYVRCMKTKHSTNTGKALVEIISESIDPTILQSDNGAEFLGE
jgi:hypothetical protein